MTLEAIGRIPSVVTVQHGWDGPACNVWQYMKPSGYMGSVCVDTRMFRTVLPRAGWIECLAATCVVPGTMTKTVQFRVGISNNLGVSWTYTAILTINTGDLEAHICWPFGSAVSFGAGAWLIAQARNRLVGVVPEKLALVTVMQLTKTGI